MRLTSWKRAVRAVLPLLLAGPLLAAVPAHAAPVQAAPAHRAAARTASLPVPLTSVSDRATTPPGGSFTVTVTLTNPHDTPIRFVFQSVQQSYDTATDVEYAGLKYAATACNGVPGQSACGNPQAGGHGALFTLPLAPGASTSYALTYTVAPDSACGSGLNVNFYSYVYYEYQDGAAFNDGLAGVQGTDVPCA
ncbi:hypothetical protein OG401_03990 [Kitasatospora purpeofusca]|uniref:hypothetical protein n=1 Tax=Kitasatospora purpeofusca TaxID=67352 RepID=UPI0022594033|nr:hypothetical protein [Kitasatospora purpeofusca]MCX4683474.1 hypothetical protein [Kitasatospora purpeofusca]